MTDELFDAGVERVLARYADTAVLPFDPVAIATAAVRAAPPKPRILRQGPSSPTPWRFAMSRLALAGAVAMLVAIAAVVSQAPPGPDVGASPSPSPSVSPDPSASAVDDALGAKWLANAGESSVLGSGAGPVSMMVSSSGRSIAASNFGPGLGFASSMSGVAPNEIELVLDRAGGDCPAGARGLYQWTLNSDRSQLTLTTKTEDCLKRGLVFARRWERSLIGETTIGAGVIDSMDPTFRVTLPDDEYQARTLDDFFEIAGSKGLSLMVFKNPQAFVDACSTDEKRVPYQPGAEAFVNAFRGNDAFTVGTSIPLKVDGHDAISVVVGAQANYARCPGSDLYQYTPKNCNCHFIAGPGGTDRWYLVEVGSDTFMFMVSPFGSAAEADVIESIRIPFVLPSQ
jgi:hypothetical protein